MVLSYNPVCFSAASDNVPTLISECNDLSLFLFVSVADRLVSFVNPSEEPSALADFLCCFSGPCCLCSRLPCPRPPGSFGFPFLSCIELRSCFDVTIYR